MTWVLAVPALLCAPWISWQVARVHAQWGGERVDRTASFRQVRHTGIAMGAFQISIATVLLGFAIDQGDLSTAATTTPALALMGLGFIIWGVRGLRAT